MKNVFALLGLVKHGLANVYMSRDERCRVRGCARKVSFATVLPAAASFITWVAVAIASDVRAIVILCAIGIRNLLHDAKMAVARERSQD
jgi:hypothetical protein